MTGVTFPEPSANASLNEVAKQDFVQLGGNLLRLLLSATAAGKGYDPD